MSRGALAIVMRGTADSWICESDLVSPVVSSSCHAGGEWSACQGQDRAWSQDE